MAKRPVALITGASTGFGAAIATRLADEGYDLILLARRLEKLQALAEQLPVSSHLIACDLREQEAVRAAIAAIPAEFADIDVLINNAGLALGLEPAHRADWQDWQQMIDTNCTALALMTRLILPGMVERQKGHLVMMGSIAGAYAYPGGNAYGATKAFVEQFARNLRADLLGTGIRVTNIEPGLVGGSEFSLVRFKGDVEKAATVYKGANALQPEDIAESVAWALKQPKHVNINSIEIMPVSQAHGPLAIHRKT
ncbi:SDR family NAD(P)-dependent oxidoreductase [Permianibacter aggregans]|uniref:3-hydroxy acid dehydrogenase/malonic semialdehyde reductase n=1 Tax=Permianibacter aggregans TaxID=1510150 RepID=A0A4R6UV99_9GAMM|nr:SDR family NAD(P)-dependent oxidoreductase [Permianibacter aggregans]QGX39396.1 SDR family NAD(P)-dependent oxidoreductase [Permianibacter aggregans]TDQ49869.1 3-hydroxy acid dehydrogenase/malonic semialdehyde reductase [Permianibacter aggregans]